MKVIVCGSRTIKDPEEVKKAIKDSGFKITELVCGEAEGPDKIAKELIQSGFFGESVPVISFKADWEKDGRGAGIIRNVKMVSYAEACIAIWDGKSKGTTHTIQETQRRGRLLYVRMLGDIPKLF